ncbi:MAG: hypothetical protein AAF772_00090 [Acidobacteriota bacterium]
MGELLSILPGLLVFLGLMAVGAFFYRRHNQNRDAQYASFASRRQLTAIDLAAMQAHVGQFPFGQRGASTVVRSAHASADGVVLMHLHQVRAASPGERDHHSAAWLALDPSAQTPHLALRVRTLQVDNAINRAIWGDPVEISLDAWPGLASYQCLGAPADRATALLHGGLGDWMAGEAQAGRVRNLELRADGLLLYQLERRPPAAERLEALVAAGNVVRHLVTRR